MMPVGYWPLVLAPKVTAICAEEYWLALAPVIAAKLIWAVLLVVVAPLTMAKAARLPPNVVLVSDAATTSARLAPIWSCTAFVVVPVVTPALFTVTMTV